MTELSLYFPKSEKNFSLKDNIMIAGRSLNVCDLPLRAYFEKGDLSLISRKHFKITFRENTFGHKRSEKFFIVDLGSRNGTEVNGLPLAKNKAIALRHGDLIRVAGEDHFLIKVIIDDGLTHIPKSKSGIYFDDSRAQFIVDGKLIPDNYLAPRDKELLQYLYENVGEVCSDDELINEVWFSAEVQNNAVTVAITRLRKKLKRLSVGAERYIERVYGQGYKLNRSRTSQ